MREMELKVAIGGQSFTTAKIEIDIISMRLRAVDGDELSDLEW